MASSNWPCLAHITVGVTRRHETITTIHSSTMVGYLGSGARTGARNIHSKHFAIPTAPSTVATVARPNPPARPTPASRQPTEPGRLDCESRWGLFKSNGLSHLAVVWFAVRLSRRA